MISFPDETWASNGPNRLCSVEGLERLTDLLRPLHARLGHPQEGDWLEEHPEPGQTFRQFLAAEPPYPDARRHTIYFQPLGHTTAGQCEILALNADFIERFFHMPVKLLGDVTSVVVPDTAWRRHPTRGNRQLLTSFLLDQVLLPRLPADAFLCLGFTGADLWPGGNYHFVLGQPSGHGPVGVWSLYRYGDPALSPEARRLCLLRTVKRTTHEIGHMLGMLHCTAYECGMCGSGSFAEADRHPLAFCPECSAKIWWSTGADPARRYRLLDEFCLSNKLQAQADFFGRCLRILDAAENTKPA